MERCRWCQGEVEPTSGRCRTCGRLQPPPQAEILALSSTYDTPEARCPACGATLRSQAQFCSRCGQQVSTGPTLLASRETESPTAQPPALPAQEELSPLRAAASPPQGAGLPEAPHLGAPWESLSSLHLGQSRQISYLDFDVEIGQGLGGVYPVTVLRSPVGPAAARMVFPFDESTLKHTLLELHNALLRSSIPHRQVLSPEVQAVQAFGQRLFEALFTDEVRRCYALSQQEAAQQDQGVRLRLSIQAPELAVLPWEYLYDAAEGDYLCLSRNTPLVRYLDLPQHPQPLQVPFPLRILGLVASPSDQDPLDIAREQERIQRALGGLEARGLVELTWLKGQTWRDVQRAMRGGPWHVFHFIGHGGFDPQADEGVLALANEAGTTQVLRATEVGRLLATHRPLRLVLLNACEGARGSTRDLFSSTAATLARRGMPAVLAMQYAISDRAALEWTQVFYEAIADGLPVDAAVADARTAVSLAIPRTLEWGTLVLYLRTADGVLFQLGERGKRSSTEQASPREATQERLNPIEPPPDAGVKEALQFKKSTSQASSPDVPTSEATAGAETPPPAPPSVLTLPSEASPAGDVPAPADRPAHLPSGSDPVPTLDDTTLERRGRRSPSALLAALGGILSVVSLLVPLFSYDGSTVSWFGAVVLNNPPPPPLAWLNLVAVALLLVSGVFARLIGRASPWVSLVGAIMGLAEQVYAFVYLAFVINVPLNIGFWLGVVAFSLALIGSILRLRRPTHFSASLG